MSNDSTSAVEMLSSYATNPRRMRVYGLISLIMTSVRMLFSSSVKIDELTTIKQKRTLNVLADERVVHDGRAVI